MLECEGLSFVCDPCASDRQMGVQIGRGQYGRVGIYLELFKLPLFRIFVRGGR
jgi:hypothetical protein